jgi:potassium-transporting ATPase KdpC subunit
MVATLRQAVAGLRLLLVLTVALGLVYPVVVDGVGRLVPGRADGSLVEVDGVVVGSALVGQHFEGDQWFQSRPSAAGDGYDPLASGASNLGPENPDLLDEVEERRAEVATRESVDPAAVPADAITASGSGLDPHVSPEYARLQVERVARARDLPEGEVAALVEAAVRGRDLGILGQPRVNVLELNVALQELDGSQG